MGLGMILGGAGVAKGIFDLFQNGAQRRQNNRMINEVGEYQADGNVSQLLGLAKTIFNSRAPGVSAAEQSILGNQATAIDATQRGGTDASQILSVIEGINGNTNNALAGLAEREAMDQSRRFGQLQNAVSVNNMELGKVWADKLRKLNMRLGVNTTYHQNLNTAVGGMTDSLGLVAADLFDKKKQ